MVVDSETWSDEVMAQVLQIKEMYKEKVELVEVKGLFLLICKRIQPHMVIALGYLK